MISRSLVVGYVGDELYLEHFGCFDIAVDPQICFGVVDFSSVFSFPVEVFVDELPKLTVDLRNEKCVATRYLEIVMVLYCLGLSTS